MREEIQQAIEAVLHLWDGESPLRKTQEFENLTSWLLEEDAIAERLAENGGPERFAISQSAWLGDDDSLADQLDLQDAGALTNAQRLSAMRTMVEGLLVSPLSGHEHSTVGLAFLPISSRTGRRALVVVSLSMTSFHSGFEWLGLFASAEAFCERSTEYGLITSLKQWDALPDTAKLRSWQA